MRGTLWRRRIGAVLLPLWLTACAGTAHHVTAGSLGSSPATAETSPRTVPASTSTTMPSTRLALVLHGLPTGESQIRSRTRPSIIPGTKTYVTWYGTSATAGPDFTSGVTVGPNAGALMALSDRHAVDVGAKSGAANANTIPPPQHVTVSGTAAIVYQDAVGWTSVDWSPRTDLIVSVTGYKRSFAQMESLARDATLQ
jgi:hypothetical protein